MGAVSVQEFAALLGVLNQPFEGRPLAVAFSGGVDSLAMVYLLTKWHQGTHPIEALIVDHGLRPESSQHAQAAAHLAHQLGARPFILPWVGSKPRSNIQAKARAMRYQLIADHCASRGIVYAFLAHHLDDQAETFILRLARGSGVDGLSCMAPLTAASQRKLTYVRPFLSIPKARLLQTLQQAGLEHDVITDSSNSNAHFARVRVRQAMPILAQCGLTPQNLALCAEHMSRARTTLNDAVAHFLTTQVTPLTQGGVCMSYQAWCAQSLEIANRILITLIQNVSGCVYKPRHASLKRVVQALRASSFNKMTLNHCIIARENHSIRIFGERP